MTNDAELLRRYAEEGVEEAFAEVVRRNLDLVYATALRCVRDGHRAEDVAQSVFIDLARKARALRTHPALVSWLYTSTRYAALKTLRAEQRRQAREQEAHLMHEMLSPEAAPEWERLRPILDDILHELGERDREVVLLRYFRGLPFAELARTLKLNEGTARMRVERALDRMSGLLARRGISSTAGALGVALGGATAGAAPAGLAASVTGAALAGAVGGGALGAVGFFLAMTKLKTLALGALLLSGLATAVIEVRANRALRSELAALASDPQRVQQENRRLRAEVAALAANNPDLAELARLRSRAAALRARPEGVTEATLRAPQNVGRATAAAAGETFGWAIRYNDFELAAQFIGFADDTPANRETFMAQCSPTVRDRFRTPEGVCAAAFFGALHKGAVSDPMVALQVFSVEEDKWPGEVKIKLWLRLESGQELEAADKYQQRAGGWGIKAVEMLGTNVLQAVRERLDPATGNYVGPKTPPPAARP
ncbi:MAG: sigma-70 family RNA polymerase sigma factor [Verrucomicrobiota bacterium]